MGVDLGVVIPRRRLPERGDRQPVTVRVQPPTVVTDPGRRPEPLQMLQRPGDGGVVGGEQPGVAGQRPPHTQRLRGRERGVEPRHRPHQTPVCPTPVHQLPAQPSTPTAGHGPAATALQRRGFDTVPCTPSPAAWPPRPHPRLPPPAPPSDSGCSTRRSPPPTTHTTSTPATSPPPDRTPAAGGHLSVKLREVSDEWSGSWHRWAPRTAAAGTAARSGVVRRRRGAERSMSIAVIDADVATTSGSPIGQVIGPPTSSSSPWRGTRNR